ncbi:hypothetical protein M9H77_29627 [Catharanthus roseus]|uniref:Uncharacterized protein n=1 Tax=Catharanthus roseus TaxID=4058 RepID=A0ACB9ZW09_CATRO|nr:hypothetical protein M9H77_29627 [Catharanthus roseus]
MVGLTLSLAVCPTVSGRGVDVGVFWTQKPTVDGRLYPTVDAYVDWQMGIFAIDLNMVRRPSKRPLGVEVALICLDSLRLPSCARTPHMDSSISVVKATKEKCFLNIA